MDIVINGVTYIPKQQNVNTSQVILVSNYTETSPENFSQIRWLDKYMVRHKGFIAGGCFKNILSGEKVKDIDVFFESIDDFNDAVDLFNSEDYKKEGWSFKYRNEKVCAFQKEGEKIWIELIESEFGTPEEILRSFDFTIAKMAYFKKEVENNGEVNTEYMILHYTHFFEHLHMKRLVIDENIPFPIGTWERTYRYYKYGYKMCRETKTKLIESIQKVDLTNEPISMYNSGGWD